jgi:CRP-like cAMP-binding protein
MADQMPVVGVKSAPRSGPVRVDGQTVQNKILLGISRKECNSFLPKLEFVQLPARRILTEIDEPIVFAYFLNDGVASIITVMADGKSVEVGLTGNEGFVGLPLIVGYTTSPTRAVVQIEGSGFKISAKDLKSVLPRCPNLARLLQRYSQQLTIQTIQIAACNRLHEVNERLARWLLMSHDRMGKSSFPLTQEFIAHMLGTRRASVTVAAGDLQKSGLITYSRGQVTIKDRMGLERASCECYRGINRRLESWRKDGG